jgi:iron complex outermembrane receptor protein
MITIGVSQCIAIIPAMAQNSAEFERSDIPVADIVVTAQNRTQNVQDVPIAISVVSGEALKAAGVTDFTSVQRVSPALQVTNDVTFTKVTVRGVGTLGNNQTQDQSIAVNVDGEYINRPTILNTSLFDIDRVEVLRGPQGTLYGRNSTGGAVNFITRKPGRELAANGSATYGNFNQVIVEGGVDVPFGDIGGVRFAGLYSDRDGYNRYDNSPLTLPQFQSRDTGRSGDDNSWAGRASLRLTPTSNLTIDAVVEYSRVRVVPATQAYVNLNAAGNGPGTDCSQNGFEEVGFSTPGVQCIPANTHFLSRIDRSNYDAPLTGTGYFNQKSTVVRGRIAYDFGPATLIYTGGYRAETENALVPLTPAYATRDYPSSNDTQSHELRLNGKVSGIEWQTGLFYFREVQKSTSGLYSPFVGPNGSFINYFERPTQSSSWSAFGQAEVPIIDQVTIVGGLRYTKDKRTAQWRDWGFLFNSGLVQQTSGGSVRDLSYDGDKVNYLAGINYKPNDSALIYAKLSTGYKAGGFDSSGTTFLAENNTAYEGGVKLNFGPGDRNWFNLSGFYYDYSDLQNDVLLDAALGNQTFNAGKATIWGIEAEMNVNLSPRDIFNASFNYLNARYDNFIASYNVIDLSPENATTLPPEENVDLAGKRLPQTPKFVIGVGYDHIFDMGASGTIKASVYTRFKSDLYFSFYNYRDTRQDSFTQTDLSLEYRSINPKFSLQAFARNLENIRPLTYANYQAAGPDDVFNWQFGAPRTYGIRLSVEY